MERTNLIEARRNAGLTQKQLAKALGDIRQATVSGWETGKEEPYAYQVPLIRGILNSYDPHLFDIFGTGIQGSSHEGITVMDAIRRHLTKIIAILGSSSVAGVPLSISSFVEPETYLVQSGTAMNAAWKLLNSGDCSGAKDIVTEYLPTLTKLAMDIASYQENAAGLVTQAKLLQVHLSNRNLNFPLREALCLDAVRYAELSGNTRLYVTALYMYGDTYTYCYRLPQRALKIFGQALPYLEKDPSLNKSGIFSNMGIAYAQDGKKDESVEYLRQARIAMPEYPQLDPLFDCIGSGSSEVDQFAGKAYLFLAEAFPKDGYGLRAYDAFNKSLSKQAGAVGYRVQALIRKSDSARVIGDMDEMVKCLQTVLPIASSKNRYKEIGVVLGSVPESWQHETAIQNLQKELTHSLTVMQ